MKLDSLVTTPQGHAPVGPPRDQNWMREPECRFQNAIQGVYVPLPHFCVPGLPPPEVCAYDMVWNKEEQGKALIIGALKVRTLGNRLGQSERSMARMGKNSPHKALVVMTVAGNRVCPNGNLPLYAMP
jgi:hypothetical protein